MLLPTRGCTRRFLPEVLDLIEERRAAERIFRLPPPDPAWTVRLRISTLRHVVENTHPRERMSEQEYAVPPSPPGLPEATWRDANLSEHLAVRSLAIHVQARSSQFVQRAIGQSM